MTPTPRSKFSFEDPDRRLRTRIDFLIALMVLQIALTFFLWMDRFKDSRDDTVQADEIGELPPATFDRTEPEKLTPDIKKNQEEQTSPIKTESETIDPIMTAAEEVESNPVKVQVLNGCGVPGIAGRTGDWLKRKGFDIVEVENADRKNYQQTLLVCRDGDQSIAREMAKLIGISNSSIIQRSDLPPLSADLTIILGKDLKRLPFAKQN